MYKWEDTQVADWCAPGGEVGREPCCISLSSTQMNPGVDVNGRKLGVRPLGVRNKGGGAVEVGTL